MSETQQVAVSQQAAGKQSAPRQDPFNWPAVCRADTMSLQTLDRARDIQHTKTLHHRDRLRDTSNNLNSRDIEGKSTFKP